MQRKAITFAKNICLAAAVGALLAACGGSSGDPLVVRTAQGELKGIEGASSLQYLGIPYAAPITPSLRWKPPQSPLAWSGTRDASKFGNVCPQPGSIFGTPSTTEDCLVLNVYTPKAEGTYPVFVWIHGGALTTGAGSDYDPSKLVEQGMTVVTINYRVGVLGFLAHPAMTAESAQHSSGNYGLMDQQAALEWVKANIASFRGDDGNVTIAGESAGGLSVIMQMASPRGAGLFHKAIVQSGGYAMMLPPLSAAEASGTNFASVAGCTGQDLACLRALSIDAVLAAQNATTVGSYVPNEDPNVLPRSPAVAFGSGNYNKVPSLQGSTAKEYSLFAALTVDPALGHPIASQAEYLAARDPFIARYGKSPPQVDAAYPASAFATLADAFDAIGTDAQFACGGYAAVRLTAASTAYMYEFADPTVPMFIPNMPPHSYGAYHGSDVPYLFNFGVPFTPAQQAVSKEMVEFWTRFAKSGNPNAAGSTAWPAYTVSNDSHMSLQPGGSVVSTRFAQDHRCALWNAS
ncbi:MAG TPA: carboxylesterase family protein [Burkholderiaceae bacterium]|nr:carboxylesterase family protein [Burkholderiaceae bacterium]